MNVQKFKADEVKKLFRHCMRTKDKNGNYYERTNPDIDFGRTGLNFCYEGELTDKTFYERKLSIFMEENQVRNRTTVVAASWVCQIPDKYEGDTKAFFDAYYKIMKKKYPYCLDCFVHMDETTPHAHFVFCPIKDGKFNAKAILTREELQGMHLWMEEELEKELGFKVELIKDETRERKELEKLAESSGLLDCDERVEYVPMRELKERSRVKILKEYEEEQKKLEEYKKYVEEYKEENNIDGIINQKKNYIKKSELKEFFKKLIAMLKEDVSFERFQDYANLFMSHNVIKNLVIDFVEKFL